MLLPPYVPTMFLSSILRSCRGSSISTRLLRNPTNKIQVERCISSSALTITKNENAAEFHKMPPKEELKFGVTFSPHMLTISYSGETGWSAPQIVPYGPLSISPAASCLNYGMTCFEGMKAYRALTGDENSNTDEDSPPDLRLFRPDLNMQRLTTSMERLSLPGHDFDNEELITCIKKLISLDEQYIPEGEGYSLYLRPNVIAMSDNLGLANPTSLILYVCTSPVGPYYKSGFKPVRLLCETKYVRAVKGGTGDKKVGGNYAPTMLPAKEAAMKGYDQVLWLLDGEITEVGAMNVFFVMKKDDGSIEIVTPPLDRGDILPGVTRRSIVEMTKQWEGYEMNERNITMEEVVKAVENNTLLEAFGAGTAAVVSPIECIHYEGQDLNIPATGDVTKKIWKDLMDIQYGKVEDHPWSVKVH